MYIIGDCKSCGFWVYKEKEASPKHYGDCRCPKFCYEYLDKEGDTNNLLYSDHEGYGGSFKTGKDFGCIHWKPREAPIIEITKYCPNCKKEVISMVDLEHCPQCSTILKKKTL